MEMKKPKTLFYKVYLTVIIIFAIMLVFGLIIFRDVLEKYENSQPDTTVSKIITEYIENGNTYALKDAYNLAVSDYETEQTVNEAVKQLTNGKKLTVATLAKKAEGYDDAYAIKADDQKLMLVYLNKSKKKDSYGIQGYDIAKVEFSNKVYSEFTVTMPGDAEITVNGVKLKDTDRKTDKIPKLPSDMNSDNLAGKQTCTISNVLGKDIDIKATTDGKELTVTKDGNSYHVVQKLDNAEADKVSEYAIQAAKAYAAYMQDDSYLGAVAKYLDKSTDFYENVRTSLVTFAWDHDSYKFTDVTSDEVHKFSNELYSCRVKFTQVLKLGTTEYRDYFDKYIYVRTSSNGYLVVDMESAGTENDE